VEKADVGEAAFLPGERYRREWGSNHGENISWEKGGRSRNVTTAPISDSIGVPANEIQ